jgi:hypothetical protein
LRTKDEEGRILKTEDHVWKRLQSLVNFMNNHKNTPIQLASWIDKYDGKIIEFHADNESFHLVFTKKNIALEEGSYPSADVTLVTEPCLLSNILSGKVRITSSLIAEDKIRVWGNFHDLTSLFKCLSTLKAS